MTEEFDYVGLKALLYSFMSGRGNSIDSDEELQRFLTIVYDLIHDIWSDLENEYEEYCNE